MDYCFHELTRARSTDLAFFCHSFDSVRSRETVYVSLGPVLSRCRGKWAGIRVLGGNVWAELVLQPSRRTNKETTQHRMSGNPYADDPRPVLSQIIFPIHGIPSKHWVSPIDHEGKLTRDATVIFPHSTMPSPPIDDFKHEQKQSRQWLLLQGRSNNGMDISTKAHCQLLRYFSAISPRGRDVVGRDVLGDESRAMLARLDAERAKHRALQGGVMRVTDSFVMKHVQEDLEERMRRLSLEHVSRKAR